LDAQLVLQSPQVAARSVSRHLPTDGDQQRFAAALEGLYPAPRETLLRALSQVDPQTIGSWLETGTLREWVKQGLHILAEKGERAELLATSFFAATSTILPVITQSEIGEWVRLGLDIEAADRPGVFSVLPDGFAALQESERLSLYRLARGAAYRSTQAAARQAYTMAGIGPRDVDFAEVHDCFTWTEISNTEDLGFCEKGHGRGLVEEGRTALAGDIPVNPSGGLKSFGHPIGASGVRMIYECVTQLRDEAGARQVKHPELGLAHNVGGPGAVSCVVVLGRG